MADRIEKITDDKHKLSRLDRFCLILARHRMAVMIGILIITIVFLVGAFRIRGEVILQDMLPYDHPYLKLHNRFAEVFGSGASTVAIAIKAEKGDIREVVEATGTINAVTSVAVGSQVSGQIYRLHADFNSKVKKGQLIAEIEPSLFEGAMLQAKADYENADICRLDDLAQRTLQEVRKFLADLRALHNRYPL